MATSAEPQELRDAVEAITRAHPDLEAFDLAWRSGRGGVLAQVAGDSAQARAESVAATMRANGLAGAAVTANDAGLWARQRAGQRSADHALLRVSHRRDELGTILTLADEAGATVVGRAARGTLYLTLAAAEIARVRDGLPPGCSAVALDLPATARGAVEPWTVAEGPELEHHARHIKSRYDPAGVW